MDITEFPGDHSWWFFYAQDCNDLYHWEGAVAFEKDPGHNDRGSFTKTPSMEKGRWDATLPNGKISLKFDPPSTETWTGQIAGGYVAGTYSNSKSGCFLLRRKGVGPLPETPSP